MGDRGYCAAATRLRLLPEQRCASEVPPKYNSVNASLPALGTWAHAFRLPAGAPRQGCSTPGVSTVALLRQPYALNARCLTNMVK